MSLSQYEDFVFEAGHLSADDPVTVWKKIHETQQKVVDYLTGSKTMHFQRRTARTCMSTSRG